MGRGHDGRSATVVPSRLGSTRTPSLPFFAAPPTGGSWSGYTPGMWDERYASVETAYGTEPNDFLKQHIGDLPLGKCLCLAEGEGRNGLFVARAGHQVTGVDQSAVGLRKFQHYAEQARLIVETVVADLAEYDLGEEKWDSIVSIWCHVPPHLRAVLHAACVRALRPGGVFLLEAYHPSQIDLKTGGPPDPSLMMTAEGLRKELEGLDFSLIEEKRREIHEGPFHNGLSAVVQVLAKKPG